MLKVIIIGGGIGALTLARACLDVGIQVELRQNKYLNNIVEQDHRRIKRLVNPSMEFGSFNTVRQTLRGYEIMNMMEKGQIQGVAKGAVIDRVKFMAEIFGVAA